MNEFSLIEKYFAPLAAPEAFGLKDDAAFLNPLSGETLVMTQDALVESVHYIGDETPRLIAKKLVRRNLSDLAAKGAKPWGCLVSIVLPPQADEPWVADFASGLKEDFTYYDFQLFGGDTARGKGPASFSMTAIGLVPRDKQIRRSGAKAGDLICVTGTLGDAAFGLLAAQGKLGDLQDQAEYLIERYHLPQPRLQWGNALRGYASSAIDISDGLVQDLGHLAKASGLGAIIEQGKIPLSVAAQYAIEKKPALLTLPLNGGDDYELLFTLSESSVANLATEFDGVNLTIVGRMVLGDDVMVLDYNQQAIEVAKTGWQHL